MFAEFLRLASIIGALPVTLLNGTTADASQVMSDLNFIVSQVNANAASLANTALINANNNFSAVQSGLNATAPANFPTAGQVQNSVFTSLSSTLGTNTITAGCTQMAVTGYATGQVFTFIPSNSNTPGSATLNINGAGPLNIAAMGSNSLGLEMSATVPVSVEYDGAKLNLLNRQPGMVLLDKQTASASMAINFFNNITGAYDEYRVVMSGVASLTANDQLQALMSIDGTTFDMGSSYKHQRMTMVDATGPVGSGATADTKIIVAQQIRPTGKLNGSFRFYAPGGGSAVKSIWEAVYDAGGTFSFGGVTGFGRYGAGPVVGLQFAMQSGLVSTGTFELYGMRKS